MRPRSGLALRHGITVLNSPGTIDCDYRGEVQGVARQPRRGDFTIERGERIAQLVFQRVERIEPRGNCERFADAGAASVASVRPARKSANAKTAPRLQRARKRMTVNPPLTKPYITTR